MQLGDISRADTAYDILSEYFNGQFSELKNSDKRHGKRRQLIAEPLDGGGSSNSPLSVSKSATSGLISTSEPKNTKSSVNISSNSVLSDVTVTPILNRTRLDMGVRNSVNENKRVELHVDDFHSVPNLIHRMTNQSGLSPGRKRVTKTPDSLEGKAEHIGDLQFKELRHSGRMQMILNELMETNQIVKELIPSIHGHRSDWGRVVEKGNKTHLRLFEEMMAEILLIHRKKFKSQTKTLMELRSHNGDLEAQVESLKKDNEILRRRVNGTDLEFEKLRSLIRAKDKHIAMLSGEIEELQEVRREYMNYMAQIREMNAKNELEREQLEARLRAEEQSQLNAQLMELQAQFLRAQKMLKEAEANVIARDMANDMPTRGIKKAPTIDGSTQSEFADFDIFDKQDGWILPISGTALARIRWRRALNFASCPACRGVGKQVLSTAVLLRRLIRGENDKKKTKKNGHWHLSDDIVQFICNLPRRIMAHRPYTLSWTVNRIWHILSCKIEADEEDLSTGYPIQPLDLFIIEKYLMNTECRSDAELFLHRLLQSVKEHYKKHPLLHTFARFLHIFNDDVETTVEKAQKSTAPRRSSVIKNRKGSSIAQDMQIIDDLLKPTTKDLPESVLTIYLFAREEMLRSGYTGAYAAPIAKAKANGNGDLLKYQNILEMASMKPPKVIEKYTDKPVKDKRKSSVSSIAVASAAVTSENATTRGNDGVLKDLCDPVDNADIGKKWSIKIESHVCVFSDYTTWVPLDRATEVVLTVLNFLSDQQLLGVCRRIEHISAFLSPQGTLSSADGNHTEIRQHMRAFLPSNLTETTVPNRKASVNDVSTKIAAFIENQKSLDANRQYTVLVNLDDALQSIAEMLLTRISYMEEKLSRIFYEGDTNGDGVLSFSEFLAIVTKIAPQFTKRRTLAMYREVLMMGENPETIELKYFIKLCNKYGLMKLVDLKQRVHERQRRGTMTASTNDILISPSFRQANTEGALATARYHQQSSSLSSLDSMAEEVDEEDLLSEMPTVTNVEEEKSFSGPTSDLHSITEATELADEVEEEEVEG